jgi:hypothetical protein
MEPQQQSGFSSRTTERIATAAFIFLLCLSLLSSQSRAETADNAWDVSLPLYLTAGGYHYSNGVSSDTFSSVNATAEVLISSSAHPYSAAVFVDYHYSDEARQDGITNIGAFVKHHYRRWDATAYLFEHNAPEADGLWAYAGRVRYRFAQSHKLGVEFAAPLTDASAPDLMLGYYATFSDKFSIKFVAGSNVKAGRHRVARTELVWQFN